MILASASVFAVFFRLPWLLFAFAYRLVVRRFRQFMGRSSEADLVKPIQGLQVLLFFRSSLEYFCSYSSWILLNGISLNCGFENLLITRLTSRIRLTRRCPLYEVSSKGCALRCNECIIYTLVGFQVPTYLHPDSNTDVFASRFKQRRIYVNIEAPTSFHVFQYGREHSPVPVSKFPVHSSTGKFLFPRLHHRTS